MNSHGTSTGSRISEGSLSKSHGINPAYYTSFTSSSFSAEERKFARENYGESRYRTVDDLRLKRENQLKQSYSVSYAFFFFFFSPFRLFRDSCERSRRWILRRMNGQKKRRGLILDEGTKASSAWNKDSAVPHFMRFDRRRIERGCFTGWPAFLFLSLWKKEQEDAVKAEREIG